MAAPASPSPAPASNPAPPPQRQEATAAGDVVATYLGLSFAVFLASLPGGAARHLASLQSRGRALAAAAALYAQQRQQQDGFGDDFYTAAAAAAASGMQPWMERSKGWQDLKYESSEPMYNTKHAVPRRESPWKVDVESSGVPAKLQLLEQELINLEKIGNGDLSKIPLVMRKQVKRYQTLAGKIDDLCKRMQTSDPCDSTLNSEFRTQRQTEYLLEAFHLQHRATETRQKLSALQAETAKGSFGDELTAEAKMSTRRALSSIRNNFKEIQRSLEIWLARILGDLEGMLARDGASRIREQNWLVSREVQFFDLDSSYCSSGPGSLPKEGEQRTRHKVKDSYTY
uniref:Uncharacterized protein n=1 Tax=Leersia perrieri TaxID=77586 RepID=A0A0D9W1I7_9ORYZ